MKNNFEKIEELSNKNSIKIIICLIITGIIIRLYFLPFNVPISLDAIDYFAYSVAMSREGIFPSGYLQSNIGWSSFLSLIFSFFKDSEMIILMDIQRTVSSFISVLTVIPIYLLIKTFFRKEISLLAVTLFLFNPAIIQNSILGITDSLFILFTILTMLFIFYKKGSIIYLSFVFVALSAFVRYEGMLLIIPLLISYIIKNGQEKFTKNKLIFGIILFLILIIPINLINYGNVDQNNIFSHITANGNFVSTVIISNEPDIDDEFFATNENHLIIFIENAVGGFIKYLGWILIPTSIVFCILGVIFVPKKITKNKIIFGLFFIFLALASVLAYGRGYQETRYLLVVLPIIILLSCYGLNYLLKINLKNISIIIIFSVILSSFIFIEYTNKDPKYELEMYEATIFLTNIASGVNNYDGNKYVKSAELQNNWPNLLPKGENGKMKIVTKKFTIEGFDEPLEYIKFNKDKGLTHLLIKEGGMEGFFDDIFVNEGNYSFLEKIYDSNDSDKITKYKIFKINYEKLK